MEKQYETEVVLKIKLLHWETANPKQIVENIKIKMKCPMVKNIEQIGELQTTPEWPWKQQT